MLTKEDPVVGEVTQTLCEWHSLWSSLFLDNQTDLFLKISDLIEELFDLRVELIDALKHYSPSYDTSGKEQQIIQLKTNIITRLDIGNRLLNLDLVIRDATFRVVDPVELSPFKLYQLHLEASNECSQVERLTSLSDCYNESITSASSSNISFESSITSSDTSASYSAQPPCHLQMCLKNHHLVSVPIDDLLEVYFSLVDTTTGSSANQTFKPMTERYLVQIMNDDVVNDIESTVFADLGNLHDRELCLHVQVYRVGRMHIMDSNKGSFNKLESNNNLLSSSQDGSTGSLTGSGRHGQNGLARNRNSTLGFLNSNAKYRRPFGTTLIYLKDYMRNPSDHLISVKIAASSESDFSHLTDFNTKRNLSIKLNQNLPNVQLDLVVRPIFCTFEKLPKNVTSSSYCITEKRDFPDIVMPGDFKNDLYLTLESGEFEKGGKSISKNIEASISLINKSGLVIDKCISPASNCDNVSCHKSCIFYHSNSPKWNESIKINVPLSEFDNAHIRIEFRHCSTKDREKKFLGFSFLPLSDEDGTVIADGSHELYLYKCDPQLWEDESLNLSKYTSLPYGPNAKFIISNSNSNSLKSGSNQNFIHSNRELINVNTFLLSTKLTQNSNLLNLLRWRELIKRNNKDFEIALRKVLDLKGEEIVKFLQDILDTLFDTFTLYSASEDDYSALIFKVLIYIFLLMDEPKYLHFRPVLDTYASAHFSATLVYKGLLACVKKCLEYSSVVEKHVPIQRCFKSMKYVFQFIVQSKLLYSKATGEQSDELFLNDLRHLFGQFEKMLSNNHDKMIPVQETFLRSFPGAIEQLSKVMAQQELANLVTSLAGSVGFILPPELAKAKLIFMKEVATSSLIKSQDVRLQITENFCRHLDSYIKQSKELHLTHEVLELLITKTHDYHWPSIYRLYQLTSKSNIVNAELKHNKMTTVGEISSFIRSNPLQGNQLDLAITSISKELDPFVSLLDPILIQLDMIIRDSNTDKMLVQKYSTSLLTILKLMGRMNFEQYVRRKRIDYMKLCNLFRAFRAVYNRDWSTMQLTSFSILEHTIDQVFKDSRARIESRALNRHQSSYIKLIVDFITLPNLQLELFSVKKRTSVLNVFGDLRIKFASQLVRYWTGLAKPGMVHDLTPTSIQPLLDASLIPNDELQRLILPIFWDMIDAEECSKSNSRQFERCFMDNLEIFFNLDRGSLDYINNFEYTLKELITTREPIWEQKGLKLISSFTNLMHLLMNYRKSMECCENLGKRMSCLVDLLNYYRDQDRSDLHIKYLFKLSDMHLELGDYTEAAFTLKLYADEIKWGNKSLPPLEDYRPEEEEWARKEALYQLIIDYFDQGKCWEETIPICKELASIYENFLVDYEKVSSTLKKLAKFLDNILTEHRPAREYFRVEFIGRDLPEFVRDKKFIFRGGEYERLPAFIQRMESQFPDSRVLSSKSKSTITKDSLGQYMVISNVKPVPFLQEHFKSGQRNINDKIIQYYLNNRVDTFSYDVPIMKNRPQTPTKGEKISELDVKNLWVGRYILKIAKQLPDILPWSEIISQDYVEISPLNHAIETVSSMNLELSKLILSYTNEPNKQLSPLTMRLQGVIEAAVNGGPSVFVDAFLKRQATIPLDQQHDVKKLRDLLGQQFSLLEAGLDLHSKLAPPEVMPLHSRLNTRFNQLFAENLGPIATRYESLPRVSPQC